MFRSGGNLQHVGCYMKDIKIEVVNFVSQTLVTV